MVLQYPIKRAIINDLQPIHLDHSSFATSTDLVNPSNQRGKKEKWAVFRKNR